VKQETAQTLSLMLIWLVVVLVLLDSATLLPCSTVTCDFKRVDLTSSADFEISKSACSGDSFSLVTPVDMTAILSVQALCSSSFLALVHVDRCLWRDVDEPSFLLDANGNGSFFWANYEPNSKGNVSNCNAAAPDSWTEPCSQLYVVGDTNMFAQDRVCTSDLNRRVQCVVCGKRKETVTTTSIATTNSGGTTMVPTTIMTRGSTATATSGTQRRTDASMTPSTSTATSRTTSASPNTSVVNVTSRASTTTTAPDVDQTPLIGGVVGGIAALFVIAGLIFLVVNKRRNRATPSSPAVPSSSPTSEYARGVLNDI
jgi:hypothetical protein